MNAQAHARPFIGGLLSGFNSIPTPAYRDWSWINGLTATETEVFKAERDRHEKERYGNPEAHSWIAYLSDGRTENRQCMCGFAWKADCSG